MLILLAAANGGPVLASRLLGGRWSWPLDGGLTLTDGRRLLGASKTVRGFVTGVLATALAAGLLGLGPGLGAAFGAAALVGDATSSFVKRRIGIESSGRALGLDQIPEALLPLLVFGGRLDLSPLGVVAVVALFTLGQLAISPLMYRIGLRKRPY